MQTGNQNSFKRDHKSISKVINEPESSVLGVFECNICLDTVQDPVVTLCGHLYCWSCIYKWIRHQGTSSETVESELNTHCPVCKTEVSQNTIVPLYGATKESAPLVDTVIPPRPPTPRYQQHAPPPLLMPGHGDTSHMNMDNGVVPSPTIVMLGEMVYGRILGDLESPLFGTPNSYNRIRNTTQRGRLQTTQADRSLSRIYTFVLCCILLCLLLFT